jgi:hypothetical protein
MRFQQASLIKGGAAMPSRARLILQYLKLATPSAKNGKLAIAAATAQVKPDWITP